MAQPDADSQALKWRNSNRFYSYCGVQRQPSFSEHNKRRKRPSQSQRPKTTSRREGTDSRSVAGLRSLRQGQQSQAPKDACFKSSQEGWLSLKFKWIALGHRLSRGGGKEPCSPLYQTHTSNQGAILPQLNGPLPQGPNTE
ncbi:hypothetical protein Q8A73_003811 [Channa argus]|nr:hypothetical protein Q8A73_003811 [Channa argus]